MVSNLLTEIDGIGDRASSHFDQAAHDIHRNGHFESVTMFKPICAQLPRCKKENPEPVIELAVEIAREGREGRRIGTLFTFGDAEAVLARSRPLILDPFAGHSDKSRDIRNLNLRGTVKELAQLDGAFVVSNSGFVVSACRYLDAMASDVVLPFGLGSRHVAGASISAVTDAVAIVVSESAMVRVFDNGGLIAEIIPELWLLSHHKIQLCGPVPGETGRRYHRSRSSIMKTDANANRAEVKRLQLDETILDAAMNSHDDETRPAPRRIVAAAGVRSDL